MDEATVTQSLERITSKDTNTFIVKCISDCAQKKINPIFSRDRWVGISTDDYVRMAPTLVIASHMLDCYETRVLHATVLNAPRIANRIVRSRRGSIGVPPSLSDAENQSVSSALFNMAMFIEITISDEADQDKALAFTRSTHRLSENPPSDASRIVMSLKYFQRLDPLVASAEELLWEWFQMASTLNHEIVHAMHFYRYGDVATEPFFEDLGLAELGVAWEVCLFGGAFSMQRPPPGRQLPDDPISIDTRDGRIMIMIPHSQVPTTYRQVRTISFDWLISLFQEEFWSKTWAGEVALRPESVFYMFIND